jgi:hypothetical protein
VCLLVVACRFDALPDILREVHRLNRYLDLHGVYLSLISSQYPVPVLSARRAVRSDRSENSK